MDVELFCESNPCTKVRDAGRKNYVSKVFKMKVTMKQFKPGGHMCPDCNQMLIQGKKRKIKHG